MRSGEHSVRNLVNLKTYQSGKRTVTIDRTTALWAGRMLMGEGYKSGKGAAVLWSMLNRYMHAPHSFKNFQSLIRNFSQPINDKWIPGGELYEKFKNSKMPVYQRATSKAAVKRRMRIRKMKWDELPDAVKRIVGQFASGTLPYPPKFARAGIFADNFASYDGVERGRPGGVWFDGEYFFQEFRKKSGIAIKDAKKSGAGIIILPISALLLAHAFKKM